MDTANAAAHLQVSSEKVVSNTDIATLALPAAIRGHVWGHGAPHGTVRVFGLEDCHGHRWEFRGRLRIGRNGGHKPEVAGAEWRRFVREKGLLPNDKLVFHRNPEGDSPLFRVTVLRRGRFRLFGVDINRLPAGYDDHYFQD